MLGKTRHVEYKGVLLCRDENTDGSYGTKRVSLRVDGAWSTSYKELLLYRRYFPTTFCGVTYWLMGNAVKYFSLDVGTKTITGVEGLIRISWATSLGNFLGIPSLNDCHRLVLGISSGNNK